MPSARLAAMADLDAIVQLASEVATEIRPHRGGSIMLRREGRRGVDPSSLRGAVSSEGGTRVVVGLFEGVVLGYGLGSTELLENDQRLGRVEALIVHPEARGIGIGEEMMNELIVWLRSLGCFAVDSQALPGDRQTKNFFESFGLKARLLTVSRALDD